MAKSLEEISKEGPGVVNKFTSFFLPALRKYDVIEEADILMQDETFGQMDKAYVVEQLQASYDDHKYMRGLGKFADSTDRIGSVVGMAVEYGGTVVGGPVGVALSWIENTAEIVFKAPYFVGLLAKGEVRKFGRLAGREVISFTPYVGNFADLSNAYMNMTNELIREDAKKNILTTTTEVSTTDASSAD